MATNRAFCELFVNISTTTLHEKRIDLVHTLRESPRVRRRHTKSRTGCAPCKQRRIKCDEAVPTCGSCGRRGDNCVRPGEDSSRSSRPSSASPASSSFPLVPRKASSNRDVSFQTTSSIEALPLAEEYGSQMELMHHFIAHTAATLIFSPEIWRGTLLRLSLQADYLYNAILMIAATHRSVLAACSEPAKDRYHHAARKYLVKTLRGYQDALSSPISSTPGDALIAVSLLLYHYAWSNVDYAAAPTLSPSSNVSRELISGLDLAEDPLLNLSVGLRYLFWKTGALATSSESHFRSYALESPRARIVQALRRQTQQQDILGQMEIYLLGGCYPHSTERLDNSALQLFPGHLTDDPVTLAAFSESAGRLAPVLAVLSSSIDVQDDNDNAYSNENRGPQPTVRITDIIRYLFSYPIHFCSMFRSLAAAHDRRALFLLLHFFHVVRRLLPPDRCWWSTRRAKLLENQLENILDAQVAIPERCTVMKFTTAARLDPGIELGTYQIREWLNGQCIHGQF